MAKQSGFVKALQLERERRDAEVRRHARVFTLDMVTIALGRMGWRETKLKEFYRILGDVSEEYAKDIIADSKEDADIWYSKGILDRELKQYAGNTFVPYDERYGTVLQASEKK